MGLHCFFSFELSYHREPRSPTGTGLPRSAVRSHKNLLQATHSLCRMVGCPLEIPRLATTADRAVIGRITPFSIHNGSPDRYSDGSFADFGGQHVRNPICHRLDSCSFARGSCRRRPNPANRPNTSEWSV